MKQILFLIVLFLVGYFVLWGGATRVLHQADINPKTIISNLAAGVDNNFLPEIDPLRNGFRFTDGSSYNKIKQNIFMTYDPNLCSAFIDLVYSSGNNNAVPLIQEYFTMFTLPDDRNKVLKIFSSYKDKQTLGILLSLYKDENIMEKANLLKPLSQYHNKEVAQIIKEASLSEEDLELAETAQKIIAEMTDKKWYQEGIKASDSDLAGNNPYAGGRYKGTDFDGEMKQY